MFPVNVLGVCNSCTPSCVEVTSPNYATVMFQQINCLIYCELTLHCTTNIFAAWCQRMTWNLVKLEACWYLYLLCQGRYTSSSVRYVQTNSVCSDVTLVPFYVYAFEFVFPLLKLWHSCMLFCRLYCREWYLTYILFFNFWSVTTTIV